MSGLSTVQVLRGAKAVLERNGWTQKDYAALGPGYDGSTPLADCPVCLRGAVNVAGGSPDPASATEASDDAWRVLRRMVYQRYHEAPIGWNDKPGRTLAEVYALLDEAIVRAEGSAS